MRIVLCENIAQTENSNVFNAVRKMVLSSGLPVEPAKINKHWPRLSYGPTVAKGQRAEREYLDIYLQDFVSVADVKQRLEAVAPQGLHILTVERVPYPLPSVQNLAAAARYLVQGDFSRLNASGREWEAFIGSDQIVITRRAENGLSFTLDGAPYLVDGRRRGPDEILCTLQCVQGKWIRPEWLIASWLGIEIPMEADVFTLDGICFTRQCLLWRDSQGQLHDL